MFCFSLYIAHLNEDSLTLSQNFSAQKKKIKIVCLSLKYRCKTQLPFSASSIVWDCLLFSSPNKSQKHPQRFHKCLHNILRASKFYLGPITFLELPLPFIWYSRMVNSRLYEWTANPGLVPYILKPGSHMSPMVGDLYCPWSFKVKIYKGFYSWVITDNGLRRCRRQMRTRLYNYRPWR